MTKDQFKLTFAPLVAALGGWLVGSGKLTSDQWGTIANLIWQYGPGLLAAAGMAYAWFKNRPGEQVKTVAALSPATQAAAIAKLPQTDQIGLASALPDKAVVAAAGAMDGVEVKVDMTSASGGAMAAALDSSVPGVNPA